MRNFTLGKKYVLLPWAKKTFVETCFLLQYCHIKAEGVSFI
jgi:hypothetical protein